MAFLPTVSLFLLATAATDEVPAEALDTEVEEGVVGEKESQGGFASCMAGTQFENKKIADGDALDADDDCEESFSVEDCLTYPADGKQCCAEKCNSVHICAGDSFVDVKDEDAAEDASDNKLTECLDRNYNPSKWAFWRWTATWKRAKYNTCDKVRAGGHMPEDNAEVALCCLPGSGEAEAEAEAEEGEGEGEDENTERRLQDDADAEAEAEAEAEEVYPKYGAELRDAMCGQSEEEVPGGETTPGSDEGGDGEQTPTESDPTGSASTFGFTALALMLVTA